MEDMIMVMLLRSENILPVLLGCRFQCSQHDHSPVAFFTFFIFICFDESRFRGCTAFLLLQIHACCLIDWSERSIILIGFYHYRYWMHFWHRVQSFGCSMMFPRMRGKRSLLMAVLTSADWRIYLWLTVRAML